MTRSFGRSRTHCLTSIETDVVLPTPVDPTIAKWRRTNSSTLTVAAIVLVLGQRADLHDIAGLHGENGAQIRGADAVGDRAERREGADAAIEHRLARGFVDDFAAKLDLDQRRVDSVDAPALIGRRDVDDLADQARAVVHDRDEVADRPIVARL